MAERKVWTEQEDKILKMLVQERKFNKWSQISKLLTQQFKATSRNGKQCRQRYLNHLATGLKKGQWSQQEEHKLIQLHNSYGNRWAQIARNFQGRTDNCVKNHLYSKLRKSLRYVNDVIQLHLRKKYKILKINFIYKLTQMAEQKYKQQPAIKSQAFQESYELKNKILNLEVEQVDFKQQKICTLINQINQFNKKYKKRLPKRKINKMQYSQSGDQQFNQSQSQYKNAKQFKQKNANQYQQKYVKQNQYKNMKQCTFDKISQIKLLSSQVQYKVNTLLQTSEDMLNYQSKINQKQKQVKSKLNPKFSYQSGQGSSGKAFGMPLNSQQAFQSIFDFIGKNKQNQQKNQFSFHFFNRVDPLLHGQQKQKSKLKSKFSGQSDQIPNIMVQSSIQKMKTSRLRSFGSIQAAFELQNKLSPQPSSFQRNFLNKQQVDSWLNNVN